MSKDWTRQTRRKEILMKYLLVPILIAGLVLGVAFAGENMQLKGENDRLNYSYGYQIGEKFKKDGISFNMEILTKGIQDALSGRESMMYTTEMHDTLAEFTRQKSLARLSEKRQKAEQHRREGREFLEKNAKKPGVVTLPSGLQYKVIREGTGKSAGPGDRVTVNYRGTLINGREFDSSYRDNKPATFSVNEVIRGWQQALQLMKEGAEWQLFIPPDLAYGGRGPLEDQTLILDLELISVESSEK
jgi:FKBP-type peptidyl-prolyl cis-trans isomerase FklB